MKVTNICVFLGACLAFPAAYSAPANQETKSYISFRPGQIWLDTEGKSIEAHGGGMFYENGTYYWFGEHGTPGRTKVGVMCYSSKDLYNWKKEGVALPLAANDPNSQSPSDNDLAIGCALERPKVIYNALTKKYVMWFHLELKGQGYDSARSGVADSERLIGPYLYLGSFRPDNSMARDMTLFVDDDGKAYQLYASEDNRTMHVSLLTDDYLKPSGRFERIFVDRYIEAPAVFKYQGRYYFMGSDCTGYAPNAARSAVASSIWGPWQELGNPCIGANADKTFFSQSTYILPVVGKPGAFIYMGDRWRGGRYVWLPIMLENDRFILKWMDEWNLGIFDRPKQQ
jgi:beta-xylosidase